MEIEKLPTVKHKKQVTKNQLFELLLKKTVNLTPKLNPLITFDRQTLLKSEKLIQSKPLSYVLKEYKTH